MAGHDADQIAYRYVGASDGRFRFGVPRRDLTVRDAARLSPSLLADIAGGADPIYAATEAAPRAGETDPEKMTRAELNAHARARGVPDPEAFPNKAELLAAIGAAEDLAGWEANPTDAADAPASAAEE